ncbi:MAG: alpha/beta hydrolase [Gammaproteobacteria bacterium]|nr:alpha/beta hydrolase [Gammaproteobacteria bacterium]
MTATQITEQGIYYRHWPVTEPRHGEPKAVIMLVHGLGEHCERYSALAEALNDAGYALCSLDLPGHGHSSGLRGHISDFAEYETAVLGLYEKIKKCCPEQSVFILGHSMGGLITTHLLLNHQHLFKGALLSGAAIQSPQEPPAWQMTLMKFIAWLNPRFGALTLDASAISRDPVVVEKYMNDPLVNKGKLSARLLVSMFNTMSECAARAPQIKLPIRIMHGGGDVMTAPAGSRLLHDRVSSQDKELKIYDGLFHEIFNEPESDQVYREVIDWLDRQLIQTE